MGKYVNWWNSYFGKNGQIPTFSTKMLLNSPLSPLYVVWFDTNFYFPSYDTLQMLTEGSSKLCFLTTHHGYFDMVAFLEKRPLSQLATDGAQQTAISIHPRWFPLCSYTSILLPSSSTPKTLRCRSYYKYLQAI